MHAEHHAAVGSLPTHLLPRCPDGTAVIRPAPAQLRRTLVTTPGAVLALGAAMLIKLHDTRAVAVATGVAVLAAVVLGVYVVRAKVIVDPLRVGRTRIFGTRWVHVGDIGRIVLAPVRGTGPDKRTFLTLLFLDKAGRRLLRLGSDLWEPADLAALAGSLGIRPDVLDRRVTLKELGATYPGAANLLQRHPQAGAALLTVAVVVAAAAGVAAYHLA